MKTLHFSIIVILFVSVFTNIEHVFANSDSISHLNVTATDYGGNGIMVNSNQTVAPFLPSPPLGMYPYTSKIFSVFQIDPEIVHPNDTSSIHILVTNNANFILYDVNLGESLNDSKSMMISNIHKINILNPNQTKTIYGTLHVSTDVQPTDYYDIWWNVVAKNQTGNMMESMQFHRNLPITQNLPQYCCDTVVITLESPLKQFKSGIEAKDVQCNNGLSLVIKAEDNSPACVKLASIKNLVSLQWALKPANELIVEEFKDTYKSGEKIDFIMKFKGRYTCGYPSSTVKNAENKTIWESPIELTLCDPDTGYGEYKWRFGELYHVILNQTGPYNVNISFSDKTLEKKFEIK